MRQSGDPLFDLLKKLSQSGVKFVVCGGVACVLHGVERATLDIDISAEMSRENLEKLVKVTKQFGLSPRISEPVENLYDADKRKGWIEKKGALVYTFVADKGPLQIDIFLKYPKSYDELISSADIIRLDDVDITVSSVEDLIYAKKRVRPQRYKDKQDIRELENKKSK